jgi:hypothetical protein
VVFLVSISTQAASPPTLRFLVWTFKNCSEKSVVRRAKQVEEQRADADSTDDTSATNRLRGLWRLIPLPWAKRTTRGTPRADRVHHRVTCHLRDADILKDGLRTRWSVLLHSRVTF